MTHLIKAGLISFVFLFANRCVAEGNQQRQPVQLPASETMAKAPPRAAPAHSDFMKIVAENSARMLEMRQKIEAKREELYAENKQISKLWAEMVEMQKQINSILDADEEYADLILKRDVLSTVLPDMPSHAFHGVMPAAGMR